MVQVGINKKWPCINQEVKGGVFTLIVILIVIFTGITDTFVPQISHEELLTYQGEDAEAKESQDHHIDKLLHRVQQGPNNDLQTWGRKQAWGEDPYSHMHLRHRQGTVRLSKLFDCGLVLETDLTWDYEAESSSSDSVP